MPIFNPDRGLDLEKNAFSVEIRENMSPPSCQLASNTSFNLVISYCHRIVPCIQLRDTMIIAVSNQFKEVLDANWHVLNKHYQSRLNMSRSQFWFWSISVFPECHHSKRLFKFSKFYHFINGDGSQILHDISSISF